MTVVEILVPMDCSGCETKIRKALKKLKGVDDIDVDLNMQKVTVMGWADQKKVLKAVRKTGKRAEIWPYPYNPQFQNINNLQYYQEHRPEDHRHHGGNHHGRHHQDRYSTQVLPITTFNSIPHSSGSGGGSSAYSYNYYKHGSTNQGYGYYQPSPYSGIFNEHDTHVFSDDNPHACSIM